MQRKTIRYLSFLMMGLILPTLCWGQAEEAESKNTPVHVKVTDAPTDDDFPAAVRASDGTVWVAYVAYQHGNPVNMEEALENNFDSLVTKGNGDQIMLMQFDGNKWSSPMAVTDDRLDVWRPTVAVDGDDIVWIIWPQNTFGNWELYARSYDPKSKKLSDVRRLTDQPGADINPVAVADSQGKLWIAWQSWQIDNFDIFLMELGEQGQCISASPVNDWNPAIAADSRGRVFISWDTYDKGNYDVLLRISEDGELGNSIEVADSLRFEARATLAVDKQDRVWIAYQEAGTNWGKDFGTGVYEGNPLYSTGAIKVVGVKGAEDRPYGVHTVRVKCFDGEVKAPAGEVSASFPEKLSRNKTFPRLAVDADGRVWLLFRHHRSEKGTGEFWVSYATYYNGDHWTVPIKVPRSVNLVDNRPALAATENGLLAIYSNDRRGNTKRQQWTNDIHAALLKAEGEMKYPILVADSEIEETARNIHPNERDDVERVRSYSADINGTTYQLLRGEFHRHTEVSSHREQDGAVENMWRYGLDVAAMDWIGGGDHDFGNREYSWWQYEKQADIFNHPPIFVGAFTHERSNKYPNGHRNVMFVQRGIRALPRGDLQGTPEKGTPDSKLLYAYLRHFDGICASHTSGTGMGTDWRDNDPKLEPIVEIYQGRRLNYEHLGAPRGADRTAAVGKPFGYVWNAMAMGRKFGFQSSSDHISTHISYAVVYAEELSREGIMEAFKKRHCYGATDNIILDVRCGDYMMGDEFVLKRQEPVLLDIYVRGTRPIAKVHIIRNFVYVYSADMNGQELKLQWLDNDPPTGQNWYYVRIEQDDGELAWSSPMWVRHRQKAGE